MTTFGWYEQTYLYSKHDVAIVIHKASPKTVNYSVFRYKGDITNLTRLRHKNYLFPHKISSHKSKFLSICDLTPYRADKIVPNTSIQISDNPILLQDHKKKFKESLEDIPDFAKMFWGGHPDYYAIFPREGW